MDGMDTKSQQKPLTVSKRRERIAQLGAEWAVLDAERESLDRALREEYSKLPEGAPTPPKLAELQRHETKIEARKKQITEEMNALYEGQPIPDRRVSRQADFYVLVRNLCIIRNQHLPGEEICKRLDLDLAPFGGRSLGLPENWERKYEVKTYLEAYRHPQCKALVQKLISVAKNKSISYHT
jgi:hypothetical protein